jgi:hypothetical protein
MKVKVKNIPVRYNGDRFLKGETLDVDEKHFDGNLFEEIKVEFIDYSSFSAEELKKIKNEDLKLFLDKKNIEYDSRANKDELIKAILAKE